MIRTVLSKSSKAFILTNLKSNYCSNPKPIPEINHVILVGTLISDAFTLPSGKKSLKVKMFDASGENYLICNVHTNGFESLKAGQRVHVSGGLRSNPIEIENEKTSTQISVQAHRIFVLENQSESKNTALEDINQVYMVTNIATDVIKSNDGPHNFKLATHIPYRTDKGMETALHFHTVSVYDEHLKNVCEDLQINDRVAIRGELRTYRDTLSDGKKKYSGLIMAKSIEKVKSREQQEDRGDVEHEANN